MLKICWAKLHSLISLLRKFCEKNIQILHSKIGCFGMLIFPNVDLDLIGNLNLSTKNI